MALQGNAGGGAAVLIHDKDEPHALPPLQRSPPRRRAAFRHQLHERRELARKKDGDMLTAEEVIDLMLLKGYYALDVAVRDGLEMLPDLD